MRFKEIVKLGELFEIDYGKETLRTKLLEITSDTEFTILQPTVHGDPVETGDKDMPFTFYRANGCYHFLARISPPYRKGNLMLCRALRVSDVKRVQRRQFYRLPIMLDMFLYELSEEGKPSGTRYKGRTKELSEKSVALTSFQKFEEKTQLAVEIMLSNKETMRLKAKVLQCHEPVKPSDPYDIVLVFTVHERDGAFLRKYIFNQQVQLRKKDL